MTPTKRSLDFLRKDGFSVWVVEKWVPATPCGFKGRLITRDVWNFGDILAVRIGQPGATLVQTTSGSNVSARLDKIRTIAEAGIWLASGNRIEVHGWRKTGPRGMRKVWTCRKIEVSKETLNAEVSRPAAE
jgi:hypothetical protein